MPDISSYNPLLEIYLLGGFQVKADGKPVEEHLWLRPSAKQLIKMLALKPHHILHRERIMDLLWAEHEPETAINSLNKAVYMARRALEPNLAKGTHSQFILTQKHQIILNSSPEAPLFIDVEEFERLASFAIRNNDVESGEKALRLYRGDLLIEDLYEDWIFARRESLRILYRKAATKTAELYADAGERSTSVEILKKLASEDASDERVQRDLMRVLAETGSKYQALRQFEQCRAALAALDLEPEPETIRLEQSIKRGEILPVSNEFQPALSKTTAVSAAPSPRITQLTFQRGGIQTAKFSPDSRAVIFSAAWEGGATQLYAACRQTGETRSFGLTEAGVFSISPLGEIAVALNRKFLRGFVSVGTLARLPLSGGAAQPVLKDAQWADWNPAKGDSTASPAARRIAVVRDYSGKNCLEYPIGNVIYKTGGWISHSRFSPDGTKIAFIEHPTLGDDGGFIALIDLKSDAGKQILTNDWLSIQGLGWSNAREIWFTAARDGNARTINAISLKSEERLLYRGTGSLTLRDVSTRGEALVTVDKTRIQIASRKSGEDIERDLSWHDWTLARDLSDDGETLLFTEAGVSGGSQYTAYTRKTDGSSAARLGNGSALALAPDGKYALVRLHEPRQQLALCPVGAGEMKLLESGEKSLNYQPWACFFPDGKRILFAAGEKEKGTRLYTQNTDGGEFVCITPDEEGVELSSPHSISPDGKRIIAIDPENNLSFYEIKTGKRSPIKNLEKDFLLVRWAEDGRYLFIRRRGQVPAVIFRYDLKTGEKTEWLELMPKDTTGVHEILRVLLTPDGKSYVYSYTRELSDLYVIEDLR